MYIKKNKINKKQYIRKVRSYKGFVSSFDVFNAIDKTEINMMKVVKAWKTNTNIIFLILHQ